MSSLPASILLSGGTSRFPRTPSTGPLTRTGGFAAGKRA